MYQGAAAWLLYVEYADSAMVWCELIVSL